MSINVANEDMVLVPDNPNVTADIARIGPYSTKVKAVNKKVTPDGFLLSVTNVKVPPAGAVIPDNGPFIVPLNATATKAKAETKLVCRTGDLSDTINAVPYIPFILGDIPYPVSFKIVIQSPGQTKVKAN